MEIVRFLIAEIPWPYPADGAERFVSEVALPAKRAAHSRHWSIRRTKSPDLIGLSVKGMNLTNNRGLGVVPLGGVLL
jgi:[ribosomal protein S5]-alanine N-acetyltransferase